MEMRKHWSDYFKGYPNFKPFRIRMMQIEEAEPMFELLEKIVRYYDGIDLSKQTDENAPISDLPSTSHQ
jgi:hypothetical protein